MATLQQQKHDVIPDNPTAGVAFEQRQRRRMLIALMMLLVALILVVAKDRQFWFSTSPDSDSDNGELPPRVMAAAPTISTKPSLPVTLSTPQQAAPAKAKSKRPSRAISAKAQETDAPFIVATNRAVLPPLQVEVVAGDQHRTLQPGAPGVKVQMQSDSAAFSTPTAGSNADSQPANSAARVELSPGTAQVVSRPVEPNYPLLAKQMKVQGAVVLEALIDKGGDIQDIQVLSGPAILSAAAREAVKQWRFKPYFQEGHPVETEARITVNFTISTY